jgi:hypothetical protein
VEGRWLARRRERNQKGHGVDDFRIKVEEGEEWMDVTDGKREKAP